MDRKLREFIIAHTDSDPAELLLHKSRFPQIDMQTAVRCIQGRRKIAPKVPSWLRFPDLLYPASLSLEQSSSQATALYKQRFTSKNERVADLTGGFGVDSYHLSLASAHVDYFERNGELADCVRENFRTMGRDNIDVCHCEVSAEVLRSMADDSYDLIFLDPARRGKAGQRVFSINDCEPDVSLLKDELLRIAPRVLVKVSPMADISALHAMFPQAQEFHVLSVQNECKEVLMLLGRNEMAEGCEATITAAELPNIHSSAPDGMNDSCGQKTAISPLRPEAEFVFTATQERNCTARIAHRDEISGVLYEPYPALTKAGAFKLPTQRFAAKKIAPDTHLYISDGQLDGFPGRARKIVAVYDVNKEFLRSFRKSVPECSVTAKNLKMTSEELLKRLGTRESSHYRLFAVSASDGSKTGILTEPLEQ